MTAAIYVLLLVAGLIGFLAHLLAQVRIMQILRRRYPQQWDIVSAADERGRRRLHTWARLQGVLRSHVPELFHDLELTRWHRCWRYGPWVAWPCWVGALVLSMAAR